MKQLTAIIATLMVCLTLQAQFATIPLPQSVTTDAKGRTLDVASLEGITCDATVDMMRNAQFLSDYTGLPVISQTDKKTVAVRLRLNTAMTNPEAYRLTTDPSGITIEGRTPAAVFYGIQVLRQALFAKPATLPCGIVESAPRFAYRGMHLDVCRHFFDKEFVKHYIDILALHGMNKLHWHISDDQGWRIEIKKWPRLTQIGAWREQTVIGRNMGIFDGQRHGGYFTQADIREIVRYAQDRYITIIPEIDMPGHMVAALTAYPELGCTGGPYEVWGTWGVSDDILCAGNPKVYTFLTDVFDEVMDLFPSDIIHVGGDEAPKVRWKECPRCQQKIRDERLQGTDKHPAEEKLQAYMVRYLEKHLAERGRRIMGWDELMEGDADRTTIIMSWRDWSGSVDPATLGYPCVKTPNSTLYFDHYQLPQSAWSNTLLFGGNSTVEKVYNYEPAPDTLTPEQKKLVMGLQANLWTEYIAYPELAEYQVLPRMAALAEVQWLSPNKKDYDDFLKRLPNLLNLYKAEGWHYAPLPKKEN